ncbi:hypothetical protein PILCRDRAFT_89094 [Piloderma croceum F 1598]|uniref:Uncharacterized protein n=1 Tax=Piloderma croceum (strain F 1598) TaxID=765440 RepID=A0A0C3FAL7_PILCF|nr:hypothetical protein PILCRDRAFT_89094 [Piloderma croceum F 1598]
MQDLAPVFQWQLSDLSSLAHRLQKANLVFEVYLSNDGPVWEALDAAVSAHNVKHNLHFGLPQNDENFATDDLQDPSMLTWHLLAPKSSRSNNGQVSRVWTVDTKGLTKFNFTVNSLLAAPYGSTTPNHLAGDSNFLMISISSIHLSCAAPRIHNMTGPIDCLFAPADRQADHVYPHRCFPARVLYTVLASRKDDPIPQCWAQCFKRPDGSMGGHVQLTAQRTPKLRDVFAKEEEEGDVDDDIAVQTTISSKDYEIIALSDDDEFFPDAMDLINAGKPTFPQSYHAPPTAMRTSNVRRRSSSTETLDDRPATRMRLESPQELNTPDIDPPPVNHITKFAPSPLLQAAMDLAPTMTDQLVSLGQASVRLAPSLYVRDLPRRQHFKIGRTK